MKHHTPNKIRIASWNIEGKLSSITQKPRGNPNSIVEFISKIDADIMVLLEAHIENSIDDLQLQKQSLTEMGYQIYSVPYQDDIPTRTDTPFKQLSLMFLCKFPVYEFNIIRLGNLRNAIVATIKVNESHSLRIIGVHLDDRLESTRVCQINDLSVVINQSDLPTIVMGDFNAMHGRDLWPAKFLRTLPVQLLSRVILPDMSMRAVEMAKGDALQLLEKSTKLIDADTKHRPTITPKNIYHQWMPSIRLIQIDHMYISSDIKISNYKISPDGGADHRAIYATVSIDTKK